MKIAGLVMVCGYVLILGNVVRELWSDGDRLFGAGIVLMLIGLGVFVGLAVAQ